MNDRSKHWVTLNEDATKILSVHYTRARLDVVAKEKNVAFIAEAWRNSLPEGEDLVKYQQMTYGKWVYFVDLNNKVAPEWSAIEAEQGTTIAPTRLDDGGRLKHWVTLNEDATEILSVHYAHTLLDRMAEDNRAAFIAEAWRSSLPKGENPDKYQLMTFGRRVYYVDVNNKAAIDRTVEEEQSIPEETAIEAEH